MPQINIRVSGAALRAFGTQGRAHAATRRAVRKSSGDSAKAMRAEAVRIVRESKRLKVKAIRKAVVVKKNKGRRLEDMEWGVNIRGGLTRLSDYPFRPTKKGVSVEINRGKRKVYEGAFVATVRGKTKAGEDFSHKGIFKRKGDDRLPIKELIATRPLGVLKKRRASRAITRRGRKVFEKSYARLFPLEMAKAGR